MAKTIKTYVANPAFGEDGEPRMLEVVPRRVSENPAFRARVDALERLELNLTHATGASYTTLEDALQAPVGEKYKARGIRLTWFDGAEWQSRRYNGTDAGGWTDTANWVEAGGGGGQEGEGGFYDLSYELFGLVMAAAESPDTPIASEQIQSALGGDEGFNSLVEAIKEGKALRFFIDMAAEGIGAINIDIGITGGQEGTTGVSAGMNLNGAYFVFYIIKSNGIYSLETDLTEPPDPDDFLTLPTDDEGFKAFWVRSNRVDAVNVFDELRRANYRRVYLKNTAPTASDGDDGDLWIQYTN